MLAVKTSCGMESTLPSVVRERILQMLREAGEAAQPRNDYTALVVDDTTLRVLSRGITVSELMDETNAVTVVDAIHAPRERRAPEELTSRMDVIYFLAPTGRSVRALLADYEAQQPVYSGSAHVFFSRRLPEDLLGMLKGSSILRYIRTLREVNLDFVALHPHAFSLDAPSVTPSSPHRRCRSPTPPEVSNLPKSRVAAHSV